MSFLDYIHNSMPVKFDDESINSAVSSIKQYIDSKTPIYIIGNGGSAFSASHFAQDLAKIFGANARSLSDNIGLVTAIGNDLAFDQIFKYQLESLYPGLLIAISFSGNSQNIVNAIEYYNSEHLESILFTGSDGGKLKDIAPLKITVHSSSIYFVEGIHSLLLHFIVEELLNKYKKQ